MIMNCACGSACLSSLIAPVQADDRGAAPFCMQKPEQSAEFREKE